MLEVRRLDLDPYIRGTTVFKRDGTVVGDGTIKWRYDHGHTEDFGTSADEYAQSLGITEPSERPKNKSEDDVVLSSSEDTGSDTTDSEDDILDDPHHHHHNSVAVGFAKFGDSVANKFSKIGPGPSLHEKKRRKREEKHARHEARRQKKLEKKRKRIEAERKHQEELEEENRKAEDSGAVENSYQAWLGQIAWAPVGVASAAVGAASSAVGAAAGAATGQAPGQQADKSDSAEPPATINHVDKEKAKDETTIEKGQKAGPERAEQANGSSGKPAPKAKGQPASGFADYVPAALVLVLALLIAYYGGSYLRGGSSSKGAAPASTSIAHSPSVSTTARTHAQPVIIDNSNKRTTQPVQASTVTVTTTQYITVTTTPASAASISAGSDKSASRPAAAARPAATQIKGKVEVVEPAAEQVKVRPAASEVAGKVGAGAAAAAAPVAAGKVQPAVLA